jgi:hypothetical protein
VRDELAEHWPTGRLEAVDGVVVLTRATRGACETECEQPLVVGRQRRQVGEHPSLAALESDQRRVDRAGRR